MSTPGERLLRRRPCRRAWRRSWPATPTQELAALPLEAVVNSFGCGNPLAYSEVRPGQVVLDLGSELKEGESCCCCGPSTGELASTWAPRLEGKVWSAKVFVRKPPATRA